MIRGLAIETSGRVGSVAAVVDGLVREERNFAHGLQHAAKILPMIDEVVRGQGWGPVDVEEVYVSAGPGSFTGLRIGVTLVKTLALATGVKVVAVPSVRVLAENGPAEARHLVIVLDAKREQIFTARFERVGSDWVEREGARLDSLKEMVKRSPRPVYLLGEGLPFHEKFLDDKDTGVVVTDASLWVARAAVVGRLGY